MLDGFDLARLSDDDGRMEAEHLDYNRGVKTLGKPSKKMTPEMPIEYDGESDQVLLGSYFDDTRTVQAAWNIQQQSVIEEEAMSFASRQFNVLSGKSTAETKQLKVSDEDKPGGTYRVHEAWRRQKLLDDMMADEEQARLEKAQEDEEAQEYPLHGRSLARKSQHQQVEDNPPTLAQMNKESSVSFGMTGSLQPTQNAQGQPPPFMPHQQQHHLTTNSEKSADFYANSSYPTYKQTHSNESSTRSGYYANTESSVRTMQGQYPPQDPSVMSNNNFGFKNSQRQTQKQVPNLNTPLFNTNSLEKNLLPHMSHLEAPEVRSTQFQGLKQQNFQNNFAKTQEDLYAQPQFKEPQTEPRYQEPKQLHRFQHFEQHQLTGYPLQRMSPPQLGAPQAHYKQPSAGAHQPTEQFLTLDHFLNDQKSPLEPKSHRLPANKPALIVSAGQQTGVNQFKLDLDNSSQRNQLVENVEKRKISNFDGRVGQRQMMQSPRVASTSPLRVDPEEIKRRQLLKQQNLEIKRRQEIEALRKQARDRELLRLKKMNAVVLIQKWVRGHLCRLEHARMRANFRYIRKLRRMLSIAYGRKKSRFIKQLVFVLKESGKKHQKNFEEEIGAFCATLIQKVWRGYYFRRVVKWQLLRQYKSQRLLRALIQGYRIRCILFRTRDCGNLRSEIIEILGQLRIWQHKLRTLHPATTTKQQHAKIKKSIAQLKEDRRVKVAQLIRAIGHLKVRGRWVHQLLPSQTQNYRIKPHKKAQSHQETYQNKPLQQIKLAPSQSHHHDMGQQQHPSIQLDNDYLFSADGQPVINRADRVNFQQNYFGDEIERENSFVFPTTAGNQMRKPFFDEGGSGLGFHDETARNLIAHVGGGGMSPLASGRAPGLIDKHKFFYEESSQACAQVASEDIRMMWPSQARQKANAMDDADRDDSMAMMWPSQQQKKTSAGTDASKMPKRAIDTFKNRFAELDNDVDDSNAEAIVWPSGVRQNSDFGEKSRGTLQNQNSIAIKSKWADQNRSNQQELAWDDQPVGGGNGPKPWDEQPVGGGGGNIPWNEKPVGGGPKPWDEQPVGGGGGPKPWDEQPVGGGTGPKPWDEQPVGGGGGPKPWDEQPVGGGGGPKPWDDQPVGGGGGPKPWDDQPVGGGKTGPKPATNSFKDQKSLDRSAEQASILSQAPPKIGLSEFELMIERAMQADASKQPGPPPSANPNPNPTPPPKNAEEKKQAPAAEDDPVKKKKNEAAAALLEKRKKYDPRKALKKGKKGATAKKSVKPAEDEEDKTPDKIYEPESQAKQVTVKPPTTAPEVIEVVEVKQPPKKVAEAKPKPKAKKPQAKAEPEDVCDPPEKPAKEPVVDDAPADGTKKPKPFLKRKTKTMQPAKINWKAKSKLDCWNADAKDAKGKKDQPSPMAKNPPAEEKTLIETQHELERSLPKFSDNQPQKMAQLKQQTAQPQPKVLEEAKPMDEAEYDLETVPNESVSCEEEKKIMPTPAEMVNNAVWKTQIDIDQTSQNDKEITQEQPRRGGSFAQPPQQQKHKPQMSGRLPSHLKKPIPTEVDDFDQEPLPRQMVQQTRHNSNRAQPVSRQPRKTPPDADTDTQNYNTFSQPDFAQPGSFPYLTMGHSPLVHDQLHTSGPFMRDGESGLNISEIQGQVSCVMTHTDIASHGFGTFNIGNDAHSRLGEEGQSNLQLEELQKVFDLFHTVTETVEEVVPQTSLQRLQARELPRPHGSNTRLGQARQQQTRKVERKSLKMHTFAQVQISEIIGQDTCIPHLTTDRSVFFQSYSSDQFEEIFEDLKGHYKRLCEEEPEGAFDDDSANMSNF